MYQSENNDFLESSVLIQKYTSLFDKILDKIDSDSELYTLINDIKIEMEGDFGNLESESAGESEI